MKNVERENILVGRKFVRERYEDVIEACSLGPANKSERGITDAFVQTARHLWTIGYGQNLRQTFRANKSFGFEEF